MKNIALITPSNSIYSETFILNHTKIIAQNIFVYHGGFLPSYLEGQGKLNASFWDNCIFTIRSIFRKNLDYNNIIDSENLYKSFRKNKIDLVFAEYGPTGAEVLGICKKANIPLIVNFHGADASDRNITLPYGYKYREVFAYASAIIGVSKEMVKDLINLGCPEEKIHYITYGPSDIFLELNTNLTSDSFLSVGRFVDKKSPYNLILAFQTVIEKYPNAKLYMAGDGMLLQTCQDLVKHFNLTDNIIFCGVLQPDEIKSLMMDSRAFVQHSVESLNGDKEGTPVAILEAQASGLPVVSTIHAGIPDIVVHDVTGYLVEENDIKSMSNYMITLLENKDIAVEMGRKAKERIRENYTLSIHSEKINNLINQFIVK